MQRLKLTKKQDEQHFDELEYLTKLLMFTFHHKQKNAKWRDELCL